MKKNPRRFSYVLTLVLLLAVAAAPQFTLLHPANAQDRTINVNERLDLKALGINNEAQRITSLLDVQAKFFKKALDLNDRGGVSLDEKTQLQTEAVQRKADLSTLRRELESLINKLKQANRWNETFDAQFLASLKNSNARSVLTQAGGARKLFQAALNELDLLRVDIDDEVQQVGTKKLHQVKTSDRRNRVFAAHARPAMGKAGCNLILAGVFAAILTGRQDVACLLAKRYQDKGCGTVDCTPTS